MFLRGSVLRHAAWLVCIGIASGAQNPAPPPGGQPAGGEAKSAVVEGSYRLGPNDTITVQCLNVDEFTNTPIRIDTDGKITLPRLGRIQAAGLTVQQLEMDLTSRLREYLLEPQVVVRLAEARSQPVSVVGSVKLPGVHQLEGTKTLLEVLSLAGGLSDDAGQTVKITRRPEWGPIPLATAHADDTKSFSVAAVDLKELIAAKTPANNIEIRPNDVISVPRAEVVYVVGEVRKPGSFTLSSRESLTVLQALSLAEGLAPTANSGKAKILRGKSADARTEVPVNLAKLLSGQSADGPMLPGDILFVPTNKAKSAGTRTLEAIITAATGVAVYRR
jgi:polysaccharide biosynthesis/export protein